MNSRAPAIAHTTLETLLGTAVLSLGVAVLVGWSFNIDVLKRVNGKQ